MKNTNIKEKIKDALIIILSVVLIIYIVLGIISMKKGDKFGFFNLRFYIVSHDLNNGEAGTGDLIISTKTSKEKVKVDNEIVYKKNNKIYVDKVILGEQNKLYVENKNFKDSVENIEVLGKVCVTAKGIGNIAMFLKSPIGMLNMLMIVLCAGLIIKKLSDNNKTENGKSEITSISTGNVDDNQKVNKEENDSEIKTEENKE
ncbi:MAG: hypothetical protein IKN09_04970 [Clostridia bacterium]|nr:hypothetical protein [Clostridia bacterium]MBR4261487.1 hypothetical protein [Clostridia bacterium]